MSGVRGDNRGDGALPSAAVDERRADAEFEQIVARARQRAIDLGELRTERERKPFVSPLSPKEREIVAEWLRDGGCVAAIAEIAAQDRGLAGQ